MGLVRQLSSCFSFYALGQCCCLSNLTKKHSLKISGKQGCITASVKVGAWDLERAHHLFGKSCWRSWDMESLFIVSYAYTPLNMFALWLQVTF